MRVKCVSTSGVSIRRQVCKTDYTGCPVPQCPLCRSDLPGASHTRSSGAYLVTCKLCAEKGVRAEYDGETGDSNAWRALQHCDDVKHKREKSAMHKHLAIHHEEEVGNPEAFTFKSVRVFPNKCHGQHRGHTDELVQRVQAARGTEGRAHQDPAGHRVNNEQWAGPGTGAGAGGWQPAATDKWGPEAENIELSSCLNFKPSFESP